MPASIWYSLGILVWVYGAALIIELLFMRKLKQPSKQYYSLLLVWAFSTYFGASLWGGKPQYLEAATQYGFAAILLAVVYFIAHKLGIKTEK